MHVVDEDVVDGAVGSFVVSSGAGVQLKHDEGAQCSVEERQRDWLGASFVDGAVGSCAMSRGAEFVDGAVASCAMSRGHGGARERISGSEFLSVLDEATAPVKARKADTNDVTPDNILSGMFLSLAHVWDRCVLRRRDCVEPVDGVLDGNDRRNVF